MATPKTDKQHRAERRATRQTETSDYAAFILRTITRLGDRIADDPAMLTHIPEIQKTLTDAVNRGVYEAKNKDWQPYSLAEMSRIAGCSYQNMQQRASRGKTVYFEQQARLEGGPLVSIAEVRAERARRLAAAGITDLTGSAHERSALAATGTDNVRNLR
jgi:hypothetical protein